MLKKKELYLKINGKVDLKIFPSPKINIYNIEAKNLRVKKSLLNFEIPKIELKISLLKLLFGDISIDKVKFINYSFYLTNSQKENSYKDQISDLYQKIKKGSESLPFSTLGFCTGPVGYLRPLYSW